MSFSFQPVVLNPNGKIKETMNCHSERGWKIWLVAHLSVNLPNKPWTVPEKIITPSKDEISKHKEYLKNFLKKNYY